MRVFVLGGTGVLGRRFVPLLAGHDLTLLVRDPARAAGLPGTLVQGDALDPAGVRAAIAAARPDVVLHQLTDLAGGSREANARIRVEGTRAVVDASLAAGVRRIVVQSVAWCAVPGDAPAAEEEPLDVSTSTGAAVAAMEAMAAELPEAVVLRNGVLHGPGTWYAADGSIAASARAGGLTASADVTSFVHADDAAAAVVAALDWPPGVVHVVDDEPVAGLDWVPAFCRSVGAPPPPVSDAPRAPAARGASNQQARSLGWRGRSWREAWMLQG